MPAHQALVDDPTAGATVESEAELAAAEAVVEDVERAEEAIAEVEEALAEGELTTEEADAVEEAIVDTAEVAVAADIEAAGVAGEAGEGVEEARDDA